MNHKPIRLTVVNHIKQLRDRNEPCVCGSGKKFKQCCWSRRQSSLLAQINQQRDGVPMSEQKQSTGVQLGIS